MTDFTSDDPQSAPASQPGDGSRPSSPLQPLGEAESWELIRAGGLGRLGYSGRFGPMIQPVNFEVQDKAIYFRVAQHGPTGEDLRTGIAHADYKVAFEIDSFDPVSQSGWSILVQGDVHPMESEDERAAVQQICVESWASGPRELFMRVTPTRISGHRLGVPPGQCPPGQCPPGQ